MAKEETQHPEAASGKRPFGHFEFRKAFVWTWNNYIIKLPGIKKLPGIGKLTQEARAVGRMQEEEIIKNLREVFDANQRVVGELKKIEGEWVLVNKAIFKSVEGKPSIIDLYKSIGIHTDLGITELEAKSFLDGTIKIERVKAIDELKDELKDEIEKNLELIETLKGIELIKLKNEPIKVIWEKFGSIKNHEEEISALGYGKLEELIIPLNILKKTVFQIQVNMGIKVNARTNLNSLITALTDNLDEIKKAEKEYYEYLSGTVIPQLGRVKGLRAFLMQHSPNQFNNTRFSHTFKIIKPFTFKKIGTKKITKIKNGEEVEEEIPVLKPMYFNPERNPYTEELRTVDEKIKSIDEVDINKKIEKLEKTKEFKNKKPKPFLASHKRIEEIIEYFCRWILRHRMSKEDPKSPMIYEQLNRKLAPEQLRKFWAEFNNSMKEKIGILSNLENPKYIKKIQEGIINQIEDLMRELRIDELEKGEEKISKFINSLKIKIKPLEEELNPEDFKTQKATIINSSIEYLEKMDIVTKGVPEFEKLITKLCDCSTKNLEQSIERVLSEITDTLIEIKLPDDEAESILLNVSHNIRDITDRVKKEIERIETAKKGLGFEKLIAEIEDIEEQITNLKKQLDYLKELRVRKEELEEDIKELTPSHPNFQKRGLEVTYGADGESYQLDEVDYGLDENGYPLEVNDKGEVLLDKWWDEISKNDWQEELILNKQKGREVWDAKVKLGVKRYGIRRIDKRFVGDLDLLDTAMFIENQWDAYRDDYRDGRYHPYSKSIMDYLKVSKLKIIPTKNINIHFDPMKEYIEFKPIEEYKITDKEDRDNHELKEEEYKIIYRKNIPDDEKDIKRIYKMRVFCIDENKYEYLVGIRRPSHLNPAFDRTALHSSIIHWGRMYYYENTDGINRWSENPFPHVSSRGIAKYLIDTAIWTTYNFEEARNALKGKEYDYGRRHYTSTDPTVTTGPYITDPLGEGGITGE